MEGLQLKLSLRANDCRGSRPSVTRRLDQGEGGTRQTGVQEAYMEYPDAQPEPGVYACTQRAGATLNWNGGGGIVHEHAAGDELCIGEARQLADGRWRGHGPEGWVSFVSERGSQLLEMVEPRRSPGRAAVRLELPTPGEWQDFYDSVGLYESDAPIDSATVARATTELLPGFSRPQALAAAYKALELGSGASIQRHELEMLFRHLLFFHERWETIEDLREDFGEVVGLEQCQECCHALVGDARTEQQLTDSFSRLSRGQPDIGFDALLTWLARRAVGSLAPSPDRVVDARQATRRTRSPLGLRPAARPPPAWAMESAPQTPISPEAVPLTPPRGPVRATVRMRGIADRVRVHGEPGNFGSGFVPGTKLFSDSPCVASEVPEYLHSARVLQGLPMLENRLNPKTPYDESGREVLSRHTMGEYVSFGPSTEEPIKVYVLYAQRDFIPAWLQRGFAKTGDIVQAAQRVNKRSDAVKFTLDVWGSKRSYTNAVAMGSPGQLHPDPSRLPSADLVKLGASDLDPVALLDDRSREWDRDVQKSDETAALKAGKLHNYVVLVVPVKEKGVRPTAEHLTAVPSHRQGTKSPSATRSRSPNPGFGSTTGYRAKSPAERSVSRGALNATAPAEHLTAVPSHRQVPKSPMAKRARSPAPATMVVSERRSELEKTYRKMRLHQLRRLCLDENELPDGDKEILIVRLLDKLAPSKEYRGPGFGSSSPMPHEEGTVADASHEEAVYGTRGRSPGRGKSPGRLALGKERELPRVARLAPTRVRTLDPVTAGPAPVKAFGSGSERIVRATSPGLGRPSLVPVARQPAGSRAKSPTPGGRAGSPRQNSPAARSKSPTPGGSSMRAKSPYSRTTEEDEIVGAVVLARLPDDGKWHRATVTQTLRRGKQVVVQFDEYATTEVVKRSDVVVQTASALTSTKKATKSPGRAQPAPNLEQPAAPYEDDFSDPLAGTEHIETTVESRQLVTAAFRNGDRVDLNGKQLGDEQFKAVTDALADYTAVTSLHLQRNAVASKGGALLGELLRQGHHRRLTTINLSQNSLGDVGAAKLLAGIAAASCVETLELAENNLGAKAATALRDLISEPNSPLRTLGLRGNNLGGSGLWQLVDSLIQDTSLTSLDLESNALGDVGGRALGLCLRHNHGLERLVISDNGIRDPGGEAIAAGLAHNSSLLGMEASHNRFSEGTADALSTTMTDVNTTLKVLDLRQTGVERTDAMDAIKDALRRNNDTRRSPSARAEFADASLHGWCAQLADRIVVPEAGSNARSVATEILLEEVLGLLRRRGDTPNIPLRSTSAAPAASAPNEQPVHRNASSPRPNAGYSSPSGSVSSDRSPSHAGSPTRNAPGLDTGGSRTPTSRAATSGGVKGSDPRAVLAFVEELFKGGLITKSVYDSRRAAILETIPCELSGVWEVDGRTSDDRPVLERIELLQLPTGELRGGSAPVRPGDESTEPEDFTVHDGVVDGDRVSFIQRYSEDEATQWTATISRPASADGSSRPVLVGGSWSGEHFNGNFTAKLTEPTQALVPQPSVMEDTAHIGEVHSRAETRFTDTVSSSRAVAVLRSP